MTEQPKTPAEVERGWFMLHLGRLSGMNEQLLEKAATIDKMPDAKKAADLLEELEELTKRYVANASSLQCFAMTWKRATLKEVEELNEG